MVELKPLEASDKEQFIKDNQEAFNYGTHTFFLDLHFQFQGKPDEFAKYEADSPYKEKKGLPEQLSSFFIWAFPAAFQAVGRAIRGSVLTHSIPSFWWFRQAQPPSLRNG